MSFKDRFSKQVATILLAMSGGIFGSISYDWLKASSDTIRAQRFEVTDLNGRTISYWGMAGGDANAPLAANRGAYLVFMDSNGAHRCRIGSNDDQPRIELYGKDEKIKGLKPRFSVQLGFNGDPLLLMTDGRNDRVVLGAIHGDSPRESDDEWRIVLRGGKREVVTQLGFVRWWDGTYRASVRLAAGSGKDWEAFAGGLLRPLPVIID